MFKENTAYIVLALIAIVLIGVTIGLQIVILSDRQPLAESPANVAQNPQGAAVIGQPSESVQLQASMPSTQNLAGQVAMAVATPTDTPVVIVLEPTPVPPTETAVPPTPEPPTATIEAPTATAVPPTPLPPTPIPPTPEPSPTEAPASPQESASAVDANAVAEETIALEVASPIQTKSGPLLLIPTVTTSADYLLGYTERGRNCVLMTQIAEKILTQRLGITVRSQSFSDAASLFDGLASGEADATLCYIDPDDRTLMRQYLGEIRQVGFQHQSGDGYKLQLWTNGGAKAEIRDNHPCMLDFLEKLNFADLDLEGQTPDSFIQANGSAINGWLACPYQ